MNTIWEQRIGRRTFLGWQIRGGLLVLTGLVTPASLLASSTPDIALAKGDPGSATRAAVELMGGMRAFVRKGQRVVIKPNMSFDQPPEMATTTHPEVISTLVRMCKEAGASRVDVLDHPLRSAELCLERSGIKEACEIIEPDTARGVISPERFKETEIPDSEQLKSTEVMKTVLKSDVLISAPVAKHHSSTGVSLSLKGMLGLIYNRGVLHWRYNLHKAIVDLCTLLKADLTVIDVTRALTTNGPSGPGKVEKLDYVLASRDMVAADAQVTSMVKWYGRSIPPHEVEHIKIAHNRGLGNMNLSQQVIKKVQV
jgi:uncharacterized protein (DUF362 family)